MAQKINWIDLLIVGLFLLTVYFILTRIFGHSASDLAISTSLFTFLGSLLYKLNREFGEFKVKTINAFDRLKEDINYIKEKIKN